MGDYYDPRIAFDHHFEQGEEFNYGALSIGGLGADRFGEYCVVLDHTSVPTQFQVGYLRGDSLRTYMTDDLTVDEAKLKQECAADSHKPLLATLKHASEVVTIQEDLWPSLVSNHDEYIEAIFTGEMRAGKVKSVRISKTDYELYYNYAYNEHREKLDELDRYRVDTFSRIDEYLEQAGITWEEIEDA